MLRTLLKAFGMAQLTKAKRGRRIKATKVAKPDFVLPPYLAMARWTAFQFAQAVRTLPNRNRLRLPINHGDGYTERRRVEAARRRGVTEIPPSP